MTSVRLPSSALLGSFFISDFCLYRILPSELFDFLDDIAFALRRYIVNRESILSAIDLGNIDPTFVSNRSINVLSEIPEIMNGECGGGDYCDATAHRWSGFRFR